MNRKAISFILAIVMIVSMLPTMALAAGNMSVTGAKNVVPSYIDESSYRAAVAFSIADADPLAAMTLEFEVPEGMSISNIVTGASIKAMVDEFDEALYSCSNGLSAGKNTWILEFTDGSDHTMSDGVLITLYVVVPNTVTNGTYDIVAKKLNDSDNNIGTTSQTTVPCTFTSGSIVVTNGVAAPASTYDVTYKNEDGTETLHTESVEEGSAPVYATAPTKADSADGSTSYSFSGWSTTQGDADDIVTLSNITEATTLYAIFEDSTNTYTVTFDPQNGSATIPVVTNVGTEVTAPTAPTKAEDTYNTYTFQGWSTSSTEYAAVTLADLTGGETVYAIYTATAKTYTVSFQNDGENYDSSKTANVGESITEPTDPTKDGSFTFKHWSTTQNGAAVVWADLEEGNYTVYAVYEDTGSGNVNQAYTITTTLDEDEYRSGDTVTATVTASSAVATNIAGFQMDISFDDAYVTLGDITAGTDFADMTQGAGEKINRVFYNTTGDDFVDLEANASVELFTVTYTVKNDVSGTATFSVTGDVIMEYGYNGNDGSNEIVSDTADIIDTVDISLTAGDNGSIGTTTEFTLDSGDTLADLKATTGYEAPTANENYVFSGWAVSGSTDTILDDNHTFTADTTLVAVFVPDSFAISVADDTTDNATVSYQTGVTNDEATYNTDVTFTVEPVGDYIISDVVYTVGEGSTGTSLTAVNGTYTIPGENITDEVTITVSAVAYYEITFSAGTGSTMDTTTLYAKAGNSGLYASVDALKAGTTTASVPTPTASTGYRLAADTAAEPLWTDSTDNVTTAWFATATFSANASYTVNTVKTWNISFAAGDNGSVSSTTTTTYDTGATVTIPTATPATGYVFENWTNNVDGTTATDLSSLTATQDITYTANFVAGTYTVTFPTVDGIAFADKTGLDNDGKATYNGDNVTFKIVATDVQIDTVKYTVGEAETVTITAVEGVYTIPSNAITADTSITVSATDIYTVTFTSGENGTVSGTTTFNVVNGETASDISAVTVTPATGYQFDGWYIGETKYANPENETVTADVTYTAKFTQIHYTFSATAGDIEFKTGYDSDYATYDTDVTFTISSDDKIITGVKLGETDLKAVNGVYTIDGDDIKGDTAALTLTVSTFDGTISFIDLEDSYMAKNSEAAGRQIMLLDAGDSNDNTYKLSDGTELSWSSAYGAYVAIVADTKTAQTLSAGMTSTSGATTNTIDYSGDVNGDGSINVIDAIIVNDILHGTRLTTTSDAYLFRADVDGAKSITAADIVEIKNTVLGITE